MRKSFPHFAQSDFANIGIIRLSAVGDIILCASAVNAIANSFPLARITWFTAPWVSELFKFPEHVDIIATKKPQQFRDYWQFYQQQQGTQSQKRAPQFDILLAMQASLRVNLLLPLMRSKHILGFDKTRGREGHQFFIDQAIPYQDNHLLDGFLQFLTQMERPLPTEMSWPIHLNHQTQEWAERQLPDSTRWIAINLRASKAERNWPLPHFQQLISELLHSYDDLSIVLTGGNTQDEQQSALKILHALNQQHLAHRLLNQVGRTTLPQLAALLSRCCCLIAPDTGPVHLARAVNTPVVGLYAVARSQLTGPYQALEHCMDVYDQAVTQLTKKSAHQVPWHFRVHDESAMSLISVEAVKAKTDVLMSKQTVACQKKRSGGSVIIS
jgi:heptosyltransferase I